MLATRGQQARDESVVAKATKDRISSERTSSAVRKNIILVISTFREFSKRGSSPTNRDHEYAPRFTPCSKLPTPLTTNHEHVSCQCAGKSSKVAAILARLRLPVQRFERSPSTDLRTGSAVELLERLKRASVLSCAPIRDVATSTLPVFPSRSRSYVDLEF